MPFSSVGATYCTEGFSKFVKRNANKMKTVIVTIPDKKEDFLISFLKKNHF
jgi:hypothetical protein